MGEKAGAPLASNSWITRVFPKWNVEAAEHLWVKKRVWTTAALCPYVRYPTNLRCLLPDITTNPPVTSDCVIIVDHLSSQAYEWAGLGATLLVLSSGDGSLDPLQTVPESFHPSWWYVSSQAICRCRE